MEINKFVFRKESLLTATMHNNADEPFLLVELLIGDDVQEYRVPFDEEDELEEAFEELSGVIDEFDSESMSGRF